MRFALGLEYDGGEFLGWQIQKQEPTVQGSVEKALAHVANHDIRVTCCGRTDSGVHALGQVAHFDTNADRSERSWLLGINSHLPDGASVLWIHQVNNDFHARFSAFSRSYRYVILNRWIRPALDASRKSWCRKPLDAVRMHDAAQFLCGEHDFTSFRASACQAKHADRHIHEITVKRNGDEIRIEVTANAFLYHMVRNIAGSLIRVGLGEESPEWIAQVLAKQDRSLAAPTAAPEGLYFVSARYPDKYEIPTQALAFPSGK